MNRIRPICVIIFIKIICGSDSEEWEMGAKIAIKSEPGCV